MEFADFSLFSRDGVWKDILNDSDGEKQGLQNWSLPEVCHNLQVNEKKRIEFEKLHTQLLKEVLSVSSSLFVLLARLVNLFNNANEDAEHH